MANFQPWPASLGEISLLIQLLPSVVTATRRLGVPISCFVVQGLDEWLNKGILTLAELGSKFQQPNKICVVIHCQTHFCLPALLVFCFIHIAKESLLQYHYVMLPETSDAYCLPDMMRCLC
jgi:hypothetical protein